MSNYQKNILLAIIVLVLVVVGFIVYMKIDKNSQKTGSGVSILNIKSDKNLKLDSHYKDENGFFSFNYPEKYTVTSFGDIENGKTVLIKDENKKDAFQIFITKFDEPGTNLTKDRIESEVGISVLNASRVNYEGTDIGLSFERSNDNNKSLREVWIAKSGYLYQLTSFGEEEGILSNIMSSWSFEK